MKEKKESKKKKLKKTIQEDIKSALEEMKDDDSIPEEYKRTLEEVVAKLEGRPTLTKSKLFIADLLMLLFRITVTFVVALAFLGFVINSVVFEEKIYVLFVALGVSVIISLVNLLAKMSLYHPMALIVVYVTVIACLVLVNNVWLPVFDFGSLWVIYFIATDILSAYFFNKLLRRKLWIIF